MIAGIGKYLVQKAFVVHNFVLLFEAPRHLKHVTIDNFLQNVKKNYLPVVLFREKLKKLYILIQKYFYSLMLIRGVLVLLKF